LRFTILIIICALSIQVNAQDRTEHRAIKKEAKATDRAEKSNQWYGPSKIRLDAFAFLKEFPAISVGYQYPLKNSLYSLEHELAFIFNGSNNSRIDKLSGVATNHTFVYHETARYALGVGFHARFLNFQGSITTCSGGNDQGCQFWQLYEDPIQLNRYAGYFRLRRNFITHGKIGFSTTVDFGRFFQRASNDDFKENDLAITDTGLWLNSLERTDGVYFRLLGQFTLRF